MFNTLENSAENRKRRRMAFCCGLALQMGVIVMAVLLALLFPEELPKSVSQYVTVFLPSLTPPPVVKPKPLPRLPRTVIPKWLPPVTPKLTIPPTVMTKIEPPKVKPTTQQLTIAVNVPAPPPEPTFTHPTVAPAPKPQIQVHTGNFGGSPEPVTTRRPASQVQTGGFGSPEGFKGQAKGESAGNVPVLGSFGLPDGPGKGNGTGGKHGVEGVVASAGFGSGVAGNGGAGRGGNQAVAMGGFQTVAQVSNEPAKNIPVAAAPVDFQPVEVISKPAPVYTEEARRSGIQGDVVLSVVFQADGHLQINGVVRPLGHGLEQAAEQAAARIRFKPAQRNGKPVDFPANLRIEFRLADQTT